MPQAVMSALDPKAAHPLTASSAHMYTSKSRLGGMKRCNKQPFDERAETLMSAVYLQNMRLQLTFSPDCSHSEVESFQCLADG
jgi:hypothetical protein